MKPGARRRGGETRRGLRAFLRDERGVAALEFSYVAFPFMAMLVAIFEVGYVHFENELLAAAVNESKRALLTGRSQNNASVTNAATFIQQYICPPGATSGVSKSFDCSKLIVDVRPVSSFAGADLSNDFVSGPREFCPGQPGQTALMRVAYPLPVILPLNLFDPAVHTVSVGGQTGAYHILMASALFQTEDFTGGATLAGC